MKVAVIGGGAAGFFAAISVKEHHPEADVEIFEKTSKLLAKVKISGGGRCNVTHACFNNLALLKHYPRGAKQLKKTFNQFTTSDTVEWFQSRGVELKTEADNRMFPVSNSSQSIIDLLMHETRRLEIKLKMGSAITNINPIGDQIQLRFGNSEQLFDKVIIASGGSPKIEGFNWLGELGHEIIKPVPSLFTFNMPQETVKKLMGVTIPLATVRVVGAKLEQSGPLLITHWGMSGPAILKTSAWGARVLNEMNYDFKIQVNWANATENEFRKELDQRELTSSK